MDQIGNRIVVAALRFLATLGELQRDRQGNVAIIFALALMPVMAAAGIGVDLSRAYLVRAHLTQALDAAGLAVAGSAGASDELLEKLAQDYFNANYSNSDLGVPGALQLNVEDNVVTLSASATLPTALLGIFGIDEMDVGSEIEVTRENKALEIVMVLDNTGSMGSSGKLDAMKDAASTLINILHGDDPDLDKLHIGLVPFAAGVNVGTDFPETSLDMVGNASIHGENFDDFKADPDVNNLWDLYDQIDNRSWEGCVQTRPEPLDELDTPPSAGTPDTLWVPWFAPDERNKSKYVNDYLSDVISGNDGKRQRDITKYDGARVNSSSRGPDAGCTMRPVTPLTNDKAQLLADIDDMNASGVTHIPVGLSWGWRLISAAEPFTEGRSYDDPSVDKAIILLTDGSNVLGQLSNNLNRSRYTAYGYIRRGRLGTSDRSAAEARLDPKTADICENIKDEGVRLYTITFKVSDSDTRDLMEECATSPALYFNSPSNEQLQTIFQAIARDLSNLRLSR